jgi:hypothetical protein
MATIYTHYDNLRVARNAPPEVIRAAYKTLSQKYHPDRNSDKDAARVMQILNASFAVLSDPVQRMAHDQWIAEQEDSRRPAAASAQPRATSPTPRAKGTTLGSVVMTVLSLAVRFWFLLLIGGLVVWSALKPVAPPPAGPKPYNAAPAAQAPAVAAYRRPALAPNGEPWPAMAGYVGGYAQLNEGGLSSVTIDNTRNDSDVFAKLVSLEGAEAYPARQIFIPAYGQFTLEGVTAGRYDVRYRDLVTGGLSRSEDFTLEEIATADGTQYTELSMTLYKVQQGNMQTFGLREDEF